MQVTVDIPDDLAAALNLRDRDPAGAALEAMALEAFRERKLTGYQLRTLLGIPSRFDLWEFLKERQIETYTPEDLQHDLVALKTALPSRMIVVGDTGPLNYLLLIDHVDVLPSLFSRVVIPRAVAAELTSDHAPEVVRRWVGNSPEWLDIQPDPADDGTLSALDSGERSAIALAVLMQATQILMDDFDGRVEAERRNLKVTGTLGILVEAHRRGLLDFESALARLSGTSFYLSPRLVEMVRRLL